MRFTSFTLLFLPTSFVSTMEENEFMQPKLRQLQQQKRYQDKLSGVSSSVIKEQGGKKNIRGVLVSGEGESNSNRKMNNNNRDLNVVNTEDALADVGILSLNSHNYGNYEDNHYLNRDLQLTNCTECCNGEKACIGSSYIIGNGSCNAFQACEYAGYTGSATIGENSCNSHRACRSAGLGGSATIYDNACNNVFSCVRVGASPGSTATIKENACSGYAACTSMARYSYSAVVGTGSCSGLYSCRYQGNYGNITIGEGSCTGGFACSLFWAQIPSNTHGDPIIIGNNACTCDRCCYSIHPGSIVGDNECTSPEDGCSYTLVGASPAPSGMTSLSPSAMPSPAPSAIPSPAPSAIPSLAPSAIPSPAPSAIPSPAPSAIPSHVPSAIPSSAPSAIPSSAPSAIPSTDPSAMPSTSPSAMPSPAPSTMPSNSPSQMPSAADCADSVCESNPNLIAVCVVGRGGGGPSTQCVRKNAAGPLLARNEGSKCGPCTV